MTDLSPSPLVSVVMPAFNAERTLGRSIESVLAQSWEDWELLVVDNASTDATAQITRQHAAKDKRVKPLSCQTPGASPARNVAIQAAKGRYIAFLDADDTWDREKLEVQLAHMRRHRLAVSWTGYRVLSSAGQWLRDVPGSPTMTLDGFLSKRDHIGCLTGVYDAEALGKILVPDIRVRNDFCLWHDALKKAFSLGLDVGGLPQLLAAYTVDPDSLSGNKLRAARYQWTAYRQHVGLSRLKSMSMFTSYAARAIEQRIGVKK